MVCIADPVAVANRTAWIWSCSAPVFLARLGVQVSCWRRLDKDVVVVVVSRQGSGRIKSSWADAQMPRARGGGKRRAEELGRPGKCTAPPAATAHLAPRPSAIRGNLWVWAWAAGRMAVVPTMPSSHHARERQRQRLLADAFSPFSSH